MGGVEGGAEGVEALGVAAGLLGLVEQAGALHGRGRLIDDGFRQPQLVFGQFDAFLDYVQPNGADDLILNHQWQDEDRLDATLAQHRMGRGGQGAFGGVLDDDRPSFGDGHLCGRVVEHGDDSPDGAVGVEAAGAVGDDGQRRALLVEDGDADLADGGGQGQLIDDDLQAGGQVGGRGQLGHDAIDEGHLLFAPAGFVEGGLGLLGQAQILQVGPQLPGDGGEEVVGFGRGRGRRVQFQQADGRAAHGDGLLQAGGLVGGRGVAQRAAGRLGLQEALPAALGQHRCLAGQLFAGLADLGEEASVAHGGGQLGRQQCEDGQIIGVQPFRCIAVQVKDADDLVLDDHGDGRLRLGVGQQRVAQEDGAVAGMGNDDGLAISGGRAVDGAGADGQAVLAPQ